MNLTQEWSKAFCSCLICVGALRCFTFPNSCTPITRPFSYTIFLPTVCACIFRINIFACVGIISVSGQGREVRSVHVTQYEAITSPAVHCPFPARPTANCFPYRGASQQSTVVSHRYTKIALVFSSYSVREETHCQSNQLTIAPTKFELTD